MSVSFPNCPACDSTNWTIRYKIDQWDIRECHSCDWSHIAPFPEDSSRTEFFSHEKSFNRDFEKIRTKKSWLSRSSRAMKIGWSRLFGLDKLIALHKKIRAYAKPGARLLDIGCSDGSIQGNLATEYQCTGIDVSETAIAEARKRHPKIEFIADLFPSKQLAGRKFDVITMTSLLEHLRDPFEALQNSFEYLDKGGVLILKTVNYHCLNRYIMKEKWTGFRPPDHLVYFTPENLKKMLRKIGFTRFKTNALAFNDNMYVDAFK